MSYSTALPLCHSRLCEMQLMSVSDRDKCKAVTDYFHNYPMLLNLHLLLPNLKYLRNSPAWDY